ncbi:hypothetical protein [Saccharopolyspora shandongensis]|uniref:hypothetical protein n=1 Tax=Saccharopolyspora shandongensis TaxID=418495 RepID=UPI0015A57929|nr:hypothetical protein [Saccharopolyspora shandongensis]
MVASAVAESQIWWAVSGSDRFADHPSSALARPVSASCQSVPAERSPGAADRVTR